MGQKGTGFRILDPGRNTDWYSEETQMIWRAGAEPGAEVFPKVAEGGAAHSRPPAAQPQHLPLLHTQHQEEEHDGQAAPSRLLAQVYLLCQYCAFS